MVGIEKVVIFLAIIGLVITIIIYIIGAIFLNKFNKLVFGKGTALAWIPICDIYLLGKLTINKFVGWFLVVCTFLNGTYIPIVSTNIYTRSLIIRIIIEIIPNIYWLIIFGLFIIAIVKYNQLKKRENT